MVKNFGKIELRNRLNMIRIKKAKNPTDHEFLKKVEIKKENHPDNIIHYIVYYSNKPIGYAEIKWSQQKQLNNNKININNVSIKNEFRRKGLASYLYDFIEKDTNFDIIPSKKEDLNNNSEPFWKNRLKKSNPIDKTFLSKIKISKTKIGISIVYKAFLNNHIIATAEYVPNDNSVSSLWVNTPYRRKGLASFMYNTIENDQKVSLQPSQDLLPDGRRFWENRLRNKSEKMGLLYR